MSDAAFMMHLNSDPDVIRYTGDSAFNTIQEAAQVMTRLKKQYEFDRTGRFIVELLETGEPIGWCGLRWFPEVSMHDLGYRFLKSQWGQGFATETSKACLEYAKNEIKVKKVFARAMSANKASIRVLEKLGFRPAQISTNDQKGCELSFLIDL